MSIGPFKPETIYTTNKLKQQDLGFPCIQGGKTAKFKSKKNGENLLEVLFSFYRTYYFGIRQDMKQCITFKSIFLKNTYNLVHSNPEL